MGNDLWGEDNSSNEPEDLGFADDLIFDDDSTSLFSVQETPKPKSNVVKNVVMLSLAVVAMGGILTFGGFKLYELSAVNDKPNNIVTTRELVDSEKDDTVDEDSFGIDGVSGEAENVGVTIYSMGREGGQDSGSGAIIAYDNAYYISRDPEAAWAINSPNNSTAKDVLTEAILGNGEEGGVIEGTEYDAEITPKVVGKTYSVVLNLTPPNGETHSYKQEIEVEKLDGKFYVKNIKNLS